MNSILANASLGNANSFNPALGLTTQSTAQNNIFSAYTDQRDYQQQQQGFRNGVNQTTNANQSGETYKIIVRNIPSSFTWQNLRDRFSEFGEVKYCDIKRGGGAAVIHFGNSREASNAVKLMNGLRIERNAIEVSHYY